ncbi:hypothetical protein DSM25558_4702 [Agrobacterium sp. DSM 25558]|uniref:GNAT family N-acetyltransferase n=1 Tax=Agrobacterium sp. DSM 25558 TaxID=1907665 RepID=UPI0009725033|nr:GNAT family N-acetyltransferase [Agrobacterium sp. DSM 25558]SCX29462.1 hypothetical protein DSM25558_4702 [Agrobacterium sp. DSM 25558]
MHSIPVIETPRLLLRSHHVNDFADYATLWADPGVVRYIGGIPQTREQSWSKLLRSAGHWHHLGFGFMAVEDKESGRFIGEAGFHEARREITPSVEGTLETGWVFFPDVHGKGYAFEAVSALIQWAKVNFPDMRMTSIIHPENGPSLKLAAKLGFVELARTDYNGDIVILSRTETPPA